jgi:hypothetical protein
MCLLSTDRVVDVDGYSGPAPHDLMFGVDGIDAETRRLRTP